MSQHYHKVEYFCKNCKLEHEQLVLCGTDMQKVPCKQCTAINMYHRQMDFKSYTGTGFIISPITKL